MPYFLCKLIPPRPTFVADMSADERAVMIAHRNYWSPHVDIGLVVAMGPVADPDGGYGVAIMDAASLEAVEALQEQDPVILAAHGFAYRNFVMPGLAARPSSPLAPVSSVTP
jgi:uncharacterized protein YciI